MYKILYLGTDPTRYSYSGCLVHCPLIKTVRRTQLDNAIASVWACATHVLFTSPTAVKYWPLSLEGKQVLSIGNGTSSTLAVPVLQAPQATQEGVIELLESLNLSQAFLFWPRSASSRPLLANYLVEKKLQFQLLDLYDTLVNTPDPLPDLDEFDELVFSSPSTVHAFMEIFGSIPAQKKITPIGPITAQVLKIINTSAMVCFNK